MITGRITDSVVRRQVKYVTPVSPASATGVVSEVYRQVADEFRFVVPPVLLHSPSPSLLAGFWMLLRETLIASGAADRAAKEAVATGVSVANACPYCVDMHSAAMYDLATGPDAEAITRDRLDEVEDPRIRSLATWGMAAHRADAASTRQPPFPESHRAELVGVAVSFHYLTRMVNVFLPGSLLPARLSPGARRRFKQSIGWLLSPALRADRPAGRSVSLLPRPPQTDAVPQIAAGWASDGCDIAEAAARSYAAFDAAGDRSVPAAVRELLSRRLESWRGERTGLGREWCEELVAGLADADRAAGRLTLLTAFASHQVDEHVVAGFLAGNPDDATLVETVGWASFAVARQVGRRLAEVRNLEDLPRSATGQAEDLLGKRRSS